MQAHRFGWLFGAAALISANAASAQDCAADADCGDGYVCKSYEYEACDDRKPCAPEDKTCIEAQQMPANCTTEKYTACEPKPCSEDSDCPDTMVCHSETYPCTGGAGAEPACPKDGDCPMIDPQPADACEEVTVSACTPRWALPCKEDADCGGGFDCKEQLIGMCSGSSGSPTPRAGSADGGVPADEPAPPPEETCTTEPSGEFYCELKELPCASDDDCPSGLECGDSYADAVCTSPAKDGAAPMSGSGDSGGSAGAGAAADAGIDTPPPEDTCANVEPKKMCMPPNYYGRGVAIADSAGGGTASGNPSSGADKGETLDDNGTAPPADPKPTGAHSAADGNDDGSSGSMNTNTGCAVSAAGTHETGVLGFLSMLGLSVLALRRRK